MLLNIKYYNVPSKTIFHSTHGEDRTLGEPTTLSLGYGGKRSDGLKPYLCVNGYNPGYLTLDGLTVCM